jgi:hypothetical protein
MILKEVNELFNLQLSIREAVTTGYFTVERAVTINELMLNANSRQDAP